MVSATNEATSQGRRRNTGPGLLISAVRAILSTEVFLVLFVYAGQFKTQPLIVALQVDFTALTGVATLLLGTAALVARSGRANKRAVLACVWMLLFAVAVWLATLWSPGDRVVEKAFLRFPLVVLSFVVCALLVSSDRTRVRRVLVLVLLTAVYVTVLALRAAAVRETTWGGLQVQGAGDYIDVGMCATVGALIVMARLMVPGLTSARRFLLMGLWAVFVLTVSLAGSRQALVILGLVTFVAAITWLRQGSVVEKAKRSWVLVLLASVTAVVIVYAVAQGASLSTVTRMDRLQMARAEESFGERPWLYRRALDYWFEQPVIGTGTASFLWDVPSVKRGMGAYPHNIFLEAMAETGLLGLVPLVALMLTCTMHLWRAPMLRDYESTAVRLVFLALLASAQVSGSFAHERPLFAFLGLLLFAPAARLGRRDPVLTGTEGDSAHLAHRG